MEYKGKLYGKIGNKYFDTGKTSDDYDALETLINRHNKALIIGGVSGSLLSDLDYWKQRCELAEKCIEESPCDPDITSDQIKSHNAYNKFISTYGNDR